MKVPITNVEKRIIEIPYYVITLITNLVHLSHPGLKNRIFFYPSQQRCQDELFDTSTTAC